MKYTREQKERHVKRVKEVMETSLMWPREYAVEAGIPEGTLLTWMRKAGVRVERFGDRQGRVMR